MDKKESISNFVNLKQQENCKRSIFFKNYSGAVSFIKDLLRNSYEITRVTVSQEWTYAGGKQPNAEVDYSSIDVTFMYNSYEEHDREHLKNMLEKHMKNISQLN